MIIKHGGHGCEKLTRCAKVCGLLFLDCAFWMLIGWAGKLRSYGKKMKWKDESLCSTSSSKCHGFRDSIGACYIFSGQIQSWQSTRMLVLESSFVFCNIYLLLQRSCLCCIFPLWELHLCRNEIWRIWVNLADPCRRCQTSSVNLHISRVHYLLAYITFWVFTTGKCAVIVLKSM